MRYSVYLELAHKKRWAVLWPTARKTATNCNFAAAIEQGAEQVQRIKNAIYGPIKTDDLVKGYDLDWEDPRIIMQIFALIDGCKLTLDEQSKDWTKYEGPVAGAPVSGGAKDGDFTSSKYKVGSRPPKGQPPIVVDRATDLPAVG